MTTIFETLGGKETFKAAVDEFYNRILADDRINHYFSHTDMSSQRKHMTAFMVTAFGGPKEYKGRSMSEAHAGMNLTKDDFEAVAGHLVGTLNHFEVPQPVIDDMVATVAGLAPEVLHK